MSSPQETDILNLHPTEEEEQFVNLLMTNDQVEERQITLTTIRTNQQLRTWPTTTIQTPMDLSHTYTPTLLYLYTTRPILETISASKDPIPTRHILTSTPNHHSLFRPYQFTPKTAPPTSSFTFSFIFAYSRHIPFNASFSWTILFSPWHKLSNHSHQHHYS